MKIRLSLVLAPLLAQEIYANTVSCVPPQQASAKGQISQVNKGQICTIGSSDTVANGTLTNNGTIIFNSGSKLTYNSTQPPSTESKITITNNADRGSIQVNGNSSIEVGSSTLRNNETKLTIEGQDINIKSGATFTFKTKELTLGGEPNKGVNIIGQGSSSNLALETTTTLNTKDATLKNLSITANSLTSWANKKASLENVTIIAGGDTQIKVTSDNSAFTLQGVNNFDANTHNISLTGTHSFDGGGSLIFTGSEITLGGDEKTLLDNQGKAQLTLKTPSPKADKKSQTSIGFAGSNQVLFKSVEISGDLRVQIIKDGENATATLKNIDTTFKGGTLEALQRKSNNSSKNQLQTLVIENGNTATTNQAVERNGGIAIGKIKISGENGNSVTTFLGSGIKIYGQEITINGSNNSSTLLLQTEKDEGEIALGKANTTTSAGSGLSAVGNGAQTQNKDGEVTIKGTDKTKHKLELKSALTTFGGNVTLEKLKITTQSAGEGMVFQGDSASTLTLKDITLTSAKTLKDNSLQYQTLAFESKNKNERSKIQIQSNGVAGLANGANEKVELHASSFSFSNQEISFLNGGAQGAEARTTGEALELYAHDTKAPTFIFANTTITKNGEKQARQNTTTAQVNLYGEGKVILKPQGLTLKNITLTAKALPKNRKNADDQTALDLSYRDGLITALGSSTIQAKEFLYGGKQGIGSAITVRSEASSSGKLTIQSQTAGTEFVLGGLLTLDNSSVNGKQGKKSETTTSTFEIKLAKANGVRQNTTLAEIDLMIEKGIMAIGNLNDANGGTTTEVKAKSLTFSKDSTLTSQNGTLKLTVSESSKNLSSSSQSSSSNGATEPIIDILGKTLLIGGSSKEAQIQVTKGVAGISASSVSAGTATLQLHDIEVQGKGKLEGKLSFVNSNITIGGGETNNFEIKNTNNSGKVSDIHSVTLKDATLDIKNSSSQGELEFNQNSYILSSGISTIKASKISSKDSAVTLKVTDGTLTLAQGNGGAVSGVYNNSFGIGDIFLGVKDTTHKEAHLIFAKNEKQKEKKTLACDSLNIQGNITTFGKTSITADSFTMENKHTISVNGTSDEGGSLELIAKNSTNGNGELKLTSGAIELNNGHLKYYTISPAKPLEKELSQEKTLGKITLGSLASAFVASSPASTSPSITSTGNSSIQASELTLNGNTITAKEGILELIGVKDTASKTGNITIGNKGLLVLGSLPQKARENQNTQDLTLKSLKLTKDSTITLSADVPYVTSSAPLGGGAFGRIQAKEVVFGSDSTKEQKLISILVDPVNTLKGEELFTLREGEQVLIDTTHGIKKTSSTLQAQSQSQTNPNITLEDISVNTGGYRSLTLTPILVEGTPPKDASSTQSMHSTSSSAESKIITQLKLGISVKQTTSQELAEGITDKNAQKEIQEILSRGDNAWIIDSILSGGNNALRPGIVMSFEQEDIKTLRDAISYINDAYNAYSSNLEANNRIQQAIQMLQTSNIQNRIARIGNPYASQAELASLLKEASKYRYASADGIKSGILEALAEGNVWATYDGAFGGGDSRGSNLNGLSAGYDQILQSNYLVGGLLSYGYGSYDGDYLHSRSHNISFGAYSRMLFDANEVDISLVQTVGIYDTRLALGQSPIPSILNGELKHNFYATNFLTRYGYSFAVGEDEQSPYYLRPFVGLGMEFLYSEGGQNNALAPMMIESTHRFDINTQLGLEVRKYFNAQTYVYLLPFFDAKVLKTGNDPRVKFVSIKDFRNYQSTTSSDMGVGIYLGGSGNINENFAVTGNFGLKMDVKSIEVMSTWNLGLKYKF